MKQTWQPRIYPFTFFSSPRQIVLFFMLISQSEKGKMKTFFLLITDVKYAVLFTKYIQSGTLLYGTHLSRCICSSWLYKWMRLWCLVIWSWLVQMLTYLVLQATSFIHHEKKLRNRRMINRLFPTPKLIPFKTMQKAKLPPYKGGPRALELCALAP